MAANVLKQFLVGIGFDTREFEKGTRKVDAGVGSMKSGILTASAAIVGAFGAAAASVAGTASRVDNLNKSLLTVKTGVNFVNAFGGALRLAGGEAEAAAAQVQGIEDILANLQLRGEFGPFGDLALAGIDTLPLTQAANAEEFLRLLAPQLQGLDEFKTRQVGQALGLDNAALRVLQEGLDGYLETARNATGDIEHLTENSRLFQERMAELGLAFEGLQNKLAEDFLPAMAGVVDGVTGLTRDLRGLLSGEGEAGQALEAAGPLAALGVGAQGTIAEPISPTLQGAAVTESIIRKTAETEEGRDSLLRLLIPGYGAAVDFFGGDAVREAGTPAVQMQSAEAEREANAQALREAISRQPVVVNSNIRVELDGEKFDKRIEEVNERAAYSALEDLQQTTGR